MQKRLEQLRLHLGHLAQRLVDPREKIRGMRESFRFLEEKLVVAMGTRLLFSRKQLERRPNARTPYRRSGRRARLSPLPEKQDGQIVRSIATYSQESESPLGWAMGPSNPWCNPRSRNRTDHPLSQNGRQTRAGKIIT